MTMDGIKRLVSDHALARAKLGARIDASAPPGAGWAAAVNGLGALGRQDSGQALASVCRNVERAGAK